MPASSYSGPVRILDMSGVLLGVGTANLEPAEEGETWTGTIEVTPGSGIAGKALVVFIGFEGRRGMAQLVPIDNKGESAHSRVIGLGPPPL